MKSIPNRPKTEAITEVRKIFVDDLQSASAAVFLNKLRGLFHPTSRSAVKSRSHKEVFAVVA